MAPCYQFIYHELVFQAEHCEARQYSGNGNNTIHLASVIFTLIWGVLPHTGGTRTTMGGALLPGLVSVRQLNRGHNSPAEVLQGWGNIQYYMNRGSELKYRQEEGEWD